ncbi:ribonucleoside triphosphate reductase [bacterium]|nr:ribonucleoside triphosphate reductase [bacterium]
MKNGFQEIVKRDGSRERFQSEKIRTAIRKAGEATGEFKGTEDRSLTLKVLSLAHDTIVEGMPHVEEIQDIVEEILLSSAYKKTAKAYILYRDQHSRIREITSHMSAELVDRYLEQSDWKVYENSNMGFSLQGLNNYVSSEVSTLYWLNEIYPPEVREAHQGGDFHIHDLGSLSVYCVGWDLMDLLTEGFRGAAGKIESRPPRHFRTALGQIVNFFYTLQGEAAGAQAFTNFDTLLAPFIRYDKLHYNDVKQALQEFVFNVNVPTRVGFQTPFTNITLDMTVPSYLAHTPVVCGGSLTDDVYGDFQAELDLFNTAFIEVMKDGDASGRIFSFPIPTYNITPDFNWQTRAARALCEATAKYGFAYFANFVNTDLNPEDARSMCCRLRIDNREVLRRGGSLFGANPLTGSIGVVTMNMPRLGYLSRTEQEFMQRLDQLMVIARSSLEIKRKILERYTDKNLYPYSQYYLRRVKERFGSYWQNHFATIGLIGMNEACRNLYNCSIADQQGQQFTLRVMDFMHTKIRQFQEETGNLYNLEATPAESTGYRLACLDVRKFPGIICANPHIGAENAEPFYTNSTNLPVNYSDDIFEILALQNDIVQKYTGGTVLHLYVGEKIEDPAMVERLVTMICREYKVPYFTITPTFSVCPQCGYQSGYHERCPVCAEECEIYSRIVGYFRTLKQWNKGKKEEFKLRKTFDKSCTLVDSVLSH